MTAPLAAAAMGEAGGAAAGAGEAAGASRAASSAATKTPKPPTMDGGNAPTKSATATSRPRTSSSSKSKGKGKASGGGSAAGNAAGSAAGARSGGALFGGGKAAPVRSKAQRLLVAEFAVCTLILMLSPLTDRHKEDTSGAWVKRASAVAALFVVLGLVSSGGPKAAKMSAAFGGLVTLVLLVSDRSVFSALAIRFNAGPNPGPAGPPANPDDAWIDTPAAPTVPGPGARPSPPVAVRPFPTNTRAF